MAMLHRHRAQPLEAAQMPAQQQETAPRLDQLQRLVKTVETKVKLLELAGEEEDAVENRRGKAVDMPRHLPQGGGTTENAAEVLARGAP